MMNRRCLVEWVAGYERAWRTPDGPELDKALAALFAAGASYRPAPFEQPYLGLSAIARMWRAERKGPDEAFTLTFKVIAADAEERTGVLQLEVHYGEPPGQVYRDLWIVRFNAEDRCEHFEEWPFWPADREGTYARGPEVGQGPP